jgi:hypothetical protein
MDHMVEISMAGTKLRLNPHQPQQLTQFHNEQTPRQKQGSINNSKMYTTEVERAPNAQMQQYL